MLHTKRKGAGRLIDHLDIPSLERFCSLCRAEGLTSGLAGSLKAPDVPRLLLWSAPTCSDFAALFVATTIGRSGWTGSGFP